METRPGIWTTEFWSAAVAAFVGLVLIILGVFKANDMLLQMGIALVGGSVASYGISRGIAKHGVPANPPTTEVEAAKVVAGQK
jgi:CHASE2 domain-containing sensor protein